MKLTKQQKDVIALLDRSGDCGDGWRKCAPKIYENLVSMMPDELVEKDPCSLRARLTLSGRVIAEWVC